MTTNITDFDRATGRTKTTLVNDHCRGSLDFNTNVGSAGTCAEAVRPTGATAGTPGTWTPTGAEAAASPGGPMVGIAPSPSSKWTTGQYVQTATAGTAGRVNWSGTGWVGGAAT